MSDDGLRLAERVRRLAAFLADSDVACVKISRGDDEIEVARRLPPAADRRLPAIGAEIMETVRRIDTIKAELVGIFRLSRPAPVEGELLAEPRELAYIEALGIRNPVHSLGAGRILAIASNDGAAVEYGQPLFLLDRG
jgi:biotin carboxyl carrier protein